MDGSGISQGNSIPASSKDYNDFFSILIKAGDGWNGY